MKILEYNQNKEVLGLFPRMYLEWELNSSIIRKLHNGYCNRTIPWNTQWISQSINDSVLLKLKFLRVDTARSIDDKHNISVLAICQ